MNNVELGNAILASMLSAHDIGNVNLDVLMTTGVSKHWFVTDAQKSIFEVINTCYKANTAFDEDIVITHLSKQRITSAQDIVLDLLSHKQVSQGVVVQYLDQLRSDFHKRTLLQLAKESQEMLGDESKDPEAVMQMMQNTINDFEFLANKGYTRSLKEVRKERKSKPPKRRIPTGIPFIDTTLSDKHGKGIRDEGLMFVSGLKQAGKTFTVMRILENVSKHRPVLFGSLEFGEELYDEGVEDAQEEGHWDGNIENIFTFDSIYDIDRVVAEIRFQAKINNIGLAAIDSMMRLTNNNPDKKTDEARLSEIFSKLGMVSKELKIPIIIIVQSSKEDLKSSMISVKGSMNADHEAYTWYHVIKTDSKNPQDERRTVIWNKNKDTHKHPKQHLMFVPATKDFYQFEPDANGEPAKPLHPYRKPKIKEDIEAEIVYDMPDNF